MLSLAGLAGRIAGHELQLLRLKLIGSCAEVWNIEDSSSRREDLWVTIAGPHCDFRPSGNGYSTQSGCSKMHMRLYGDKGN